MRMTITYHDPKGYYAVLGLLPGADLTAIKAAYRNRAKEVHPDRNPTEAARAEFQSLVEAYRVLKDVVYRAEYDATGVPPLIDDGDDYPATPFACSCCGKVTVQPRYVIFHQVKSFLVWAKLARVEGIFCRDCADRVAARASTLTWLWGWWSPPGLLLAPLALLRNLFGGTKPRDQNARMLIRQARAFLALDEVDLARALTEQAARFARLSVHSRQIERLRDETGRTGRRLKNRWAMWNTGVFFAQALPLVALPLVLGLAAMIAMKPWEKPVSTRAGINVLPAEIGDIRYVAVEDLKLRQAPVEGAPVLTLLDRFTSVQVVDVTSPEWAEVRAPSGVVGWVHRRALYAGTSAQHKQEWCASNTGTTPESGEVLLRRATGEHRLLIHNDGRRDAVVKLKTPNGHTVASYFVPATHHIGVGGIPDGTFRIEFASGSQYSRACGIFVSSVQAALLPFTLTFHQISAVRMRAGASIPEVVLVTARDDPKQPQPLDIEQFTRDD